MYEGLFGGFLLFYWSVCQLLYPSRSFGYFTVEYTLKSGNVTRQALFSFLNIALALWGILWFHANFRIVCSTSVKCHWNFVRDCTESVNHPGKNGHFNNINSSNPWTWDIFPFVCILFNFFHHCFISFSKQICYLLVKLTSKYFILFDAIINGIVSRMEKCRLCLREHKQTRGFSSGWWTCFVSWLWYWVHMC